ncbi:MAG TPA: hypothetical protein VF133_00630 [Terriglobales bacterium]
MDPAQREQAERDYYIKNLEKRVGTLIAQLRAAVSQTEKLTHDVIDAVPALRKVSDDPAAQKLINMFGDNQAAEEIQAKLEPMHSLMAQINAGAPIPQVSATDVKQLWDASRRMSADRPPRPGFAVGLSVYAGYGVDCAAEHARFMAVQWRHMLLADLIDRGLLADWVRNGEPDERVFEAAATVDCSLEDLGRATLKTLGQTDADFAAHATETLRAQGQDLEHPEIERRFVELLRDKC